MIVATVQVWHLRPVVPKRCWVATWNMSFHSSREARIHANAMTHGCAIQLAQRSPLAIPGEKSTPSHIGWPAITTISDPTWALINRIPIPWKTHPKTVCLTKQNKVKVSKCTWIIWVPVGLQSYPFNGLCNSLIHVGSIHTPPTFNIAPEKWWLEDEFPFEIAYF